MVDKCGGLPLAIIVLSGLLSHKRGLGEWQMVKDRLWKNIEDDSIEISYILSLSYNDLSTALKQCFRYFGIFPEGQVLEAENIMRLWMAEGMAGNGTGTGTTEPGRTGTGTEPGTIGRNRTGTGNSGKKSVNPSRTGNGPVPDRKPGPNCYKL
ncbi:hypothetical protein KY284_019500 [Solanum tuberosum]|nr:hypothetical protein KY284_019500 [Solanum tuberosum]